MPYGEPVFFEGEYKKDRIYPLYVQMLTCTFKVKKNKIPTIQLKNHSSFLENEYITDSGDEPICLVLSNIDLQLFKDQYDIENLKYKCGWKFKSINGLFTEYIDKWIKRKNEATISGNKGQRTLAKLMLNSLYGKFATKIKARSKIPYLGEDNIVHYRYGEEEERSGVYLPIRNIYYKFCKRKDNSHSSSYYRLFT